MLDQDSSFYQISLNVLITCLLKNVWILKGVGLCISLLGAKGLLLFINFDEEVGRVKTKLFPGGKKTKLSTYLFIYLLTLPYNNNQNLKKLKKKKEKKMKKKKKWQGHHNIVVNYSRPRI